MNELVEKIKYALCLLGVFLITAGIYSYVKYNEKPVKFETLKVSEIKNGMMVEGQVNLNFGIYEEKASSRYGITTSKKYYYIIPIEDKYMGISVDANSKRYPIFTAQTKKTYEHIKNNGAQPTPIRIKGTIQAMKTKEVGFLGEAITKIKLTEEDAGKVIVPYYIVCDAFSDYLTKFIIGVICLILGIVLVIKTRNS